MDLVHPHRPLHPGGTLAQSVVDCAIYSGGSRQGGKVSLQHALNAAAEHSDGFVWIGLHQPSSACLAQVAERFGLHPLAVEDAVVAHQRPKLEVYGEDALFVVFKTVRYVDYEEVIETGELMLFVGPRFVVSVRHGAGSALREVRAELERTPARLARGPVAVLYAVMDRVVDDYLPAAEAVEDDVDEIEEQVFAAGRSQPTERIYKLKRELVEFRRAVEPLREPALALAQGRVPGVQASSAEWFRDIHDHVERAADQVATMDGLLDSALAANLAQVTVQQNNDMRKISAWVAIFAVSTLVAGVYGMNFEHMPELEWQYGYGWALGLMVVISALLYRTFKRNDWL